MTNRFSTPKRAPGPLGLIGCAVMALCYSANASAQAPDAGLLLREELRRSQTPPAAKPALPAPAKEAETTEAESGPRVNVTAFRIVGLRTLPDAEAQKQLAAFVGQSIPLKGLHRVAKKMEEWLRAKGLFMAQAYVPPQEIAGGVVELRVIEGTVEGVDVKRAPGTRQSDDTLRAFLTGALPAGAALEQERLERGLLLANDLPATSARAVLVPGKETGGVRLLVEAAQGPIVSGNAELDNTGNRLTGVWRTGAAVFLNDAYGRGDQWNLRASRSQGTSFVRAGYTTPLGSNGWKAGLSLIGSRYNLCCELPELTPDADGEATSASAFVGYALVRTRLNNLSASFNLAGRGFVNRQLGVATSDKRNNVVTLGIFGDSSDLTGLLGEGATTTYGVQVSSGRMDLDRVAADQVTDDATSQTQGKYSKVTAQATHLVRVFKASSLYAGIAAQWASKNLDSAEKFVLGGPQGVRAYSTGDGVGDQGWVINAEWRHELAAQWSVTAFVDYGRVTVNRNPWTNWNAAKPTLENSYALSGAGVSAVWTPMQNAQVTATLATKLGENPARDANGRDADNTDNRARIWLQGTWLF